MRRLLYLVILVALVWSAYWILVAGGMHVGLARLAREGRDAGWVASYRSLTSEGYPTRVRSVLHGVELADPRSGIAWRAANLQIVMPGLHPTRITAILPPRQQVSTPLDQLTITSSSLRTDLWIGARPSLPLRRAGVLAQALDVASDRGWRLRLARGQLQAQQNARDPRTQDVTFSVQRLSPAAALFRVRDPDGLLAQTLDSVDLKAEVGFDTPWGRSAAQGRLPRLTAIALTALTARWGDLGLAAQGRVTVDAQGRPAGDIVLRVRNWRRMLRISVASGWIDPDAAARIEGGLAALASLSATPDDVNLPLHLGGGTIYLGPVPLGPTPRLILP